MSRSPGGRRHVSVVHHRSAGSGGPRSDELAAWVGDAQCDVTVLDPRDPTWAEHVDPTTAAVLAAGGDGTVAAVLKAMAWRDLPVGIVPLGTANNVARTLGAPTDDPRLAVRLALAPATPVRHFDLPLVGSRRVVESAGGGVVASAVEAAEEAQARGRIDGDLTDALEVLHGQLVAAVPMEWRVAVDGVDRSGAFLGVEVMNIASLGPGIVVAPGADPGDGLLDVVLVPESARERLLDHVGALLHHGEPEPLDLVVDTARHVVLTPPAGVAVRLDDELASRGQLTIRVDGGGVDVLDVRRTPGR